MDVRNVDPLFDLYRTWRLHRLKHFRVCKFGMMHTGGEKVTLKRDNKHVYQNFRAVVVHDKRSEYIYYLKCSERIEKRVESLQKSGIYTYQSNLRFFE